MKSSAGLENRIKIQAKRNVELWIYSFADMYMILSVFFIAVAVIFSAKAKQQVEAVKASAGRGMASVVSELELEFDPGSVSLNAKTIDEMSLLLPALKQMHEGYVEVEGYADAQPVRKDSGYSSNLDLSTRRAVRVAEWLMKNGVSPRRVRTFSYGDAHLWTSKDSVNTNRRVLVKLTSTSGRRHE